MNNENNMPDYVKRMVEEYKELRERNTKLMNFIKSEKFKEIHLIKKRFLLMQSEMMAAYENILSLRLDMEMIELSQKNKEEN